MNLVEASTRPAKLETTPLPYGEKDLDPVLSADSINYHYGHLAKGYAKRYNAGEGNADFGLLSERFWLFKQLPKTRVVMDKAGRCEVKRDVNIMTLDDPGVFDTEIFQSRSKTVFLSGEKMIQKRLELNPWQLRENPVHDARRFLGKQPKISKFTMIRSAARYLRRRLKISPLRPAEKTFFQMMGAMAHINNETLNRKKAYAA